MNTNSNLEFRKIPSLNFLYEINENGTIFRNAKSKKQNKITLDMHHSNTGYYKTMINNKTLFNTTKRLMIHNLVAECWLGPKPDGCEVDHIDRNSHNNDFRNLRYVTKSEQMKNRDYTNIVKNLKNKNVPVRLINCITLEQKDFFSMNQAAKYIAEKTNANFRTISDRFGRRPKKIYDFDIIYLNAETKHGSSTEQEIVQQNTVDLTGDYKSAFNKGKQQEVEQRVKHNGKEIK